MEYTLQPTRLSSGQRLFLSHLGRSRSGLSHTVSVYVRVAGGDQEMWNVSHYVALVIKCNRADPPHNALVLKSKDKLNADALGKKIAGMLAKNLNLSPTAFSWEWLS